MLLTQIMVNTITFPFTVAKVQTLADGAPRITIDLPESCIPEMGMLAQSKLDGIYLQATITVANFLKKNEYPYPSGWRITLIALP